MIFGGDQNARLGQVKVDGGMVANTSSAVLGPFCRSVANFNGDELEELANNTGMMVASTCFASAPTFFATMRSASSFIDH